MAAETVSETHQSDRGHNSHTNRLSQCHDKRRQEDVEHKDSGNDEEDNQPGKWKKIPGLLPKVAKERALNVGCNTTLAQLAREYGKTIQYMMAHAGLSVRPSRAPNPFNMFKAWYANKYHNQIADDVDATKSMLSLILLG
jgi:hypothetical protein